MSIFFPKNRTFDALFLELAESIKNMTTLFSHFANEYKDFESYAEKSHRIEQQADKSAHKILNELESAFITPYDREDLHALVVQMDDVVDMLDDAINGFYMYNITDKRDCVAQFAKLYQETALHLLDLIRSCFGEKKGKGKEISKKIIAIHTVETTGDEIYIKNIRQLFLTEKDPIELMKWHVIIDNLEIALDAFEKTANTVESLRLKAG